MHPKRDLAIALRFEGYSYLEISKMLGMHKSTLHYILRDIPLTDEQKERLEEKERDNQRRLVAWFQGQPELTRRKMSSRGGAKGGNLVWERRRDEMLKIVEASRGKANLTYRRDEIPIKDKLEKLYGCVFHREVIGNRVMDFASDELLIEHTSDWTHGTFDLVRRMEDVAGDTRRKIAYLDTKKLGAPTRKRLENVGVEIIDFRSLV